MKDALYESIENNPICPKITYDKSLDSAPYKIEVHEGNVGRLLKHEGWKDEDIRDLEILVKRGKFQPIHNGVYDNKRHQVTIGTEWLWDDYQKNNLTNEQANTKLEELLTHELGHADDEKNPNKNAREMNIKNKAVLLMTLGGGLLISLGVNEVITNYGNAPEDLKTLTSLTAAIAIILHATMLYRKLSPLELSAREFSEQHKNSNLITFEPKN